MLLRGGLLGTLVVASFASLAGCGDREASPDPVPMASSACADADLPPAVGSVKVLLISIDGLRSDAIEAARATNLLALACRGARSSQARTVDPTLTLPSHASMISGHAPEAHGLLWNGWQPGHIQVPTVFGVAHAAGLRTVMVVGKDKLEQLVVPGSLDRYVFAPGGDADVVANALAEIQQGFDLMLVHLPSVDATGHSQSWMSSDYLAQVRAADDGVAQLLSAVPSHTTVIVTADHGGSGTIHWSGQPEDSLIPWIAAGPRIRRGHVVVSPVVTTDTAATIAMLLGISLSDGSIGRPVAEAFVVD